MGTGVSDIVHVHGRVSRAASPAAGTHFRARDNADETVPAIRRTGRQGRIAAGLQAVAPLLWIPQAGLLAASVGAIATGSGANHVYGYAIGVFLLGALRSGLDALGGRMAFRHARQVLTERRLMAVACLCSHSPIDATRPSSGFAASTLAEQAEAIVPYLARFRPARLRATVVPTVIFLCVLALSWAAAFVLLVAAPLIPMFMALVGWRAKAASEEQLVELGSMNGFLLDRLRGLTTIRSMGAVDLTARRLRADAESLRTRTMAVLKIAFLSSAVLELFSALGVAMVAVYVGFNLLGQIPFGTWDGTLTLAQGLFILLLAPAFFEPLRDLSSVWHDRAAGEAALAALDGLGAQSAVGSDQDAFRPHDMSMSLTPLPVRVEDLRFAHRSGDRTVFASLSLDVAAGEHVALMGASGAGKSTLLALLAGLARPQAGRITIHGLSPPERSRQTGDGRVGWFGQHPYVCPGTLIGNVTLGRQDVTIDHARAALDSVGLGEAAARRGAAPVGENGVGLSGGEASRLALARIAAAPGVGLILADEPTAHLDSDTAQSVTDTLLKLAYGRTLIVATHDPVLASRMGRIIDLQASQQEAGG